MKKGMNKIKELKLATKIVAVLVIVALVIGSIIFLNQPKKTKNEDASFEASLYIELTSTNIKDNKEVDTQFILGSDIEVVDDTKEKADVKLIINNPTEVSHKLSEATYTLNMTSAPIESDGSTYKIPDNLKTVEVSKDKTVKKEYTKDDKDKTVYQTQTDSKVKNGTKKINVTIELERIDVKDMSKEQLEAVITRIEEEAPEQYNDLVKELNEKKTTIESKSNSVEDVTQGSHDTDNNNTDNDSESLSSNTENGSDSGNTGNGSNSGNSSGGNTTPTHSHSWQPIYIHYPAEESWMYYNNRPSEIQTPYIHFGDGNVVKYEGPGTICGYAPAPDSEHGVAHIPEGTPLTVDQYSAIYGTNSWTLIHIDAWDELVGYECSCGATKGL